MYRSGHQWYIHVLELRVKERSTATTISNYLAATHTLTVSDGRACCILKFPIIRTRARLIAFMLRLGAINPDRR